MKTIPIETEHGIVNYVPVHERIRWCKENRTDYEMRTSYVVIGSTYIFRAEMTVHTPSGPRVFTGHASETISSEGVNLASALENAETSTVGRALAFFGVGIENGIASADEMKKVENPVDSLKKYLETQTTKEGVEETAKQFQKKYPDLYKDKKVQGLFKKRIGELIIKQGEGK